ncbi:chemotaxis protein CheA [Methanoplanus limicola]|uniref:Chemotaxis protein CheA n=1 Tax=Methanoplanus limicola DSM 2279 TaxID=937775 RepID=H1Z4C3_9EURY|nr:chemotaxis protein CheA [Methanoplanus limicola]EHQ36671.1 CheA signal transduction histidine kinase [Methanoplanus limicola DSM 2279]
MTDEESYRKLFVAESLENHETIVNNILILEEGSDDTAIDEIFRSAHTLKGMSASMGYSEMEHLCHKMEDVFHCIRSGAIEISPELTDLLLACTDSIEEMIDDVENGGDTSTFSIGDFISQLEEIESAAESCKPEGALSGDNGPVSSEIDAILNSAASAPYDDKNESPETSGGKGSEVYSPEEFDPDLRADYNEGSAVINRYRIVARLSEDCNMKDVRSMIILQNLEDLGRIISSRPTAGELDEGVCSDIFEVVIESEDGEEALLSAAKVTDVSEVEVFPAERDISSKNPVYRLDIIISPECSMKDIRAMIILQNLEKAGDIISSRPTYEEIDAGSIEDFFSVIMTSEKSGDDLIHLSSGPDTASVSLFRAEGSDYSFDSAGWILVSESLPKTPDESEEVIPGAEAESVNPADDGKSAEEPASNELSESVSGMKIPEKKEKSEKKKKEVKNIRVDISRLDQMMNLVEDLVINGGRLKQISKEYQIKEMDEALSMVGRSISDLQNLMMYIRMIPLNQIFNRFPRVVRDVAHHDGKEVEFIMTGGETELDRSVIDGLGDPLLHLIRNGVNHGIETPEERLKAGKPAKGTLTLSAWRDQGNVIIELADDGGGIPRDKVLRKAIERNLISPEDAELLPDEEVPSFLFQAGFSTAEQVTDISGRGVGLDVVKGAIESLKGSIKVSSTEGKGTKFRLTLPPTMAIIEVMMVRINKKRCAIPINAVVEVAKIDTKRINRIGSTEAVLLRDEVLQISRLDEMFGACEDSGIVVIVQNHGTKSCIPVDVVEGQQEVVVKPVSNVIGNCPGVGGITIPGDGDVVPILDVNTMIIM